MMDSMAIETTLGFKYYSDETNVSSFPDRPAANPTALYRGLTLHSVFQPIGGIVNGNVVGYEALLRAATSAGFPVAPPSVFDTAADHGELLLLNQIVSDLHIASFCARDPGDCWLFLNISTMVLDPMISQSGNLRTLAAKHGIAPARIVVEVLEENTPDADAIDDCLRQYKDAGFLVAMDDFGKGWSNLDRIFNFLPSIVKFDLSLIIQGRSNPKVQRAYRHMTAMLHEVGIMVLAEGIETIEDAAFMVEAGVDFVQGYWLSRPDVAISSTGAVRRIHELRVAYAAQTIRTDREDGDHRTIAETALREAAALYTATGDLGGAAAIFHAVPNARRFIVLDANGSDLGSVTVPAVAGDLLRRSGLAPVRPGRSSSLVHRKYFRDAVRCPNQVHFASPVYSLVDGASSDVVAKAITRHGKPFVLCGIYLKP